MAPNRSVPLLHAVSFASPISRLASRVLRLAFRVSPPPSLPREFHHGGEELVEGERLSEHLPHA